MIDGSTKMGSDVRGDPSSAMLGFSTQLTAGPRSLPGHAFDLSEVLVHRPTNILDTIRGRFRDHRSRSSWPVYTADEAAHRPSLPRAATDPGQRTEALADLATDPAR